MSAEDSLLAAYKAYLQNTITESAGKAAFGWPVFLPNTGAKKTYPCIGSEIETSEESIPNTGNMDVTFTVSIESPMKGSGSISDDQHRLVVKQVAAELRDDPAFREFANTGLGTWSPLYVYRTYVSAAIPDPSASKKILTSSITVRAICIGVNVG